LLASEEKVFLFDVPQPLDLLAYPELIPGARRVPRQEVLNEPSLIPQDEDVIVYCTCPGDKTSRTIFHELLIDVLFCLQLRHQAVQIVLLIVGGGIPRQCHFFGSLVELTL
jgi:hypothetical protein